MTKPKGRSAVNNVKKYVLGFMFNPEATSVLLIRKNRPDWQRGLLNGIGGKVNEFETPMNAIIREFREETGVDVGENWDCRILLMNRIISYNIWIFSVFSKEIHHADALTDESLSLVPVSLIPSMNEVIPNLKWMIPLILDKTISMSEVYDRGPR